MNELITIAKGVAKLKIHVDALEDHLRLGWKQVEAEVEDEAKKVETEITKLVDGAEKELQNAEAAITGKGRRGNAAANTPQA